MPCHHYYARHKSIVAFSANDELKRARDGAEFMPAVAFNGDLNPVAFQRTDKHGAIQP